MFTPLAIHKNRITEINRFDNTVVATSTSQKVGGYFQNRNAYFAGKNEGTIVVQAWPNSDDLRYNGTGTNRFKWMFWNSDSATSGWFSICVATDDNIQIGAGSNYTLLDNTLGWKKGQMGVQCRFRPSYIADGLILINSGSTYDWTDPQPIRIAFTCDNTAQKYSCSLNGETAVVVEEARSGDPDWTGYQFLSDLGGDVDVSLGYSNTTFKEILMSGSYYEWSFYNTPLTQSEMNTITSQPYGQPSNVLTTQPDVHYVFTEENKSATLTYDSFGTDVSYTDDMSTEFQTAGQITSGSVFDAGTKDYRTRL
jgi:hypothetical protein